MQGKRAKSNYISNIVVQEEIEVVEGLRPGSVYQQLADARDRKQGMEPYSVP